MAHHPYLFNGQAVMYPTGQFNVDDAISICDSTGSEFARGLSNYSSADALQILGKPTGQHRNILGYAGSEYLVHRDNISLLPSRFAFAPPVLFVISWEIAGSKQPTCRVEEQRTSASLLFAADRPAALISSVCLINPQICNVEETGGCQGEEGWRRLGWRQRC